MQNSTPSETIPVKLRNQVVEAIKSLAKKPLSVGTTVKKLNGCRPHAKHVLKPLFELSPPR
jgi:hypothetical protein